MSRMAQKANRVTPTHRTVPADGHTFGVSLGCVCGARWESHQRNPQPCALPSASERRKQAEALSATEEQEHEQRQAEAS